LKQIHVRRVAGLLSLLFLSSVPALGRESDRPASADGPYRYAYDAGTPAIRVGVDDSCDIELERGETVRRAFLSDTVRWKLADGVSGPDNVPHLIVKPAQVNITAMLIVLTDRRAYHIRLVATSGLHAEYVGFVYPAVTEPPKRTAEKPQRLSEAPAIASGCDGLDSGYAASGASEFRSAQVCNDGKHTYISLPEFSGDLPLPYSRDNGVDEIVNYSYEPSHRRFVIDGVPKEIVLIRTTARGQVRTTFERKSP